MPIEAVAPCPQIVALFLGIRGRTSTGVARSGEALLHVIAGAGFTGVERVIAFRVLPSQVVDSSGRAPRSSLGPGDCGSRCPAPVGIRSWVKLRSAPEPSTSTGNSGKGSRSRYAVCAHAAATSGDGSARGLPGLLPIRLLRLEAMAKAGGSAQVESRASRPRSCLTTVACRLEQSEQHSASRYSPRDLRMHTTVVP